MGNLHSTRDWGYAPEYVEAKHLLLQQEKPGEYVTGTGESHSIREFLGESLSYAGMDWHKYVETDSCYFRPTEVDYLPTDPTKFKEKLGWEPKIKFHELVRIMVDADLELPAQRFPGEGRKFISEKFKWSCWTSATFQRKFLTLSVGHLKSSPEINYSIIGNG